MNSCIRIDEDTLRGQSLRAVAGHCVSPRQSVLPHQSACVNPCCFALLLGARPPEFISFEVTYAFTFITAR